MIDFLYLSPHLDDATLSCGGQIWQQAQQEGKKVLIVTITAGDPPATGLSAFAQELHDRWQNPPAQEMAARREEDIAACAILKADFEHWDVPDCVYRRTPDGREHLYPTWPDCINFVHPADKSLIADLVQRMEKMPAATQVYTPLALGGHVDHQVVRQAAEQVFGNHLLYYEDYPYVQKWGMPAEFMPANGWHSQITPLPTEAISGRIAAIAAYRSQLSSLFDNPVDMPNFVNSYITSIGGERFWQYRPSQKKAILHAIST